MSNCARAGGGVRQRLCGTRLEDGWTECETASGEEFPEAVFYGACSILSGLSGGGFVRAVSMGPVFLPIIIVRPTIRRIVTMEEIGTKHGRIPPCAHQSSFGS